MKICRVCEESKPLTEFRVRPQNLGGLDHKCKDCDREYQRKYKSGYRARSDVNYIESKHIDMKGIRKSEWCQTYRILSILGYNVEDDIHTQFVERHPGMTLKQRPARNIKSFTADDCKDETPTYESQGFEYEQEED